MFEEIPSGDSLFNWYNSDNPTDVHAVEVFSLDEPSSFDIDIQNEHSFGHIESLENANECSNCSALLGKRRLKPRHHCRICNRSVCAACSPNLLQLDDSKELHRACRSCVSSSLSALKSTESMISRLVNLGDQLQRLAQGFHDDGARPKSLVLSSGCDLDVATRLCEEAVIPLENSLRNARRNARKRTAEIRRLSSHPQEVATAYLPKTLNGNQVLEAEGRDNWRAINAVPGTDGLAYRREKRLDAKMEEVLAWGETMQGFDEGDDWVLVHLPQGTQKQSIEIGTQCSLPKEVALSRNEKEVGIHCVLGQETHGELELQLAWERANVEQMKQKLERENQTLCELQLQHAQEQETRLQVLQQLQRLERSWKTRCWSLIVLAAAQLLLTSPATSRWLSQFIIHGLISRFSGKRLVWIVLLKRRYFYDLAAKHWKDRFWFGHGFKIDVALDCFRSAVVSSSSACASIRNVAANDCVLSSSMA